MSIEIEGCFVKLDNQGRVIESGKGVAVRAPDQFEKERDNAKRGIENDPGH